MNTLRSLARGVPSALVALTAACATARPGWVEHVPLGYAHEYVVGVGSDSSRAVARRAAIAAALARAAEGDAVRVGVTRADTISREERVDERGAVRASRRFGGTLAVTAESPEVTLRDLRVVDEFTERSRTGTDVWVLMRRPRDDGHAPPGPASLALRSALVPGWGQVAKRQPRRGAAILSAIAVSVPAAVVLGSLRADAAVRARRAQTTPTRTYWRDHANTLGAARTAAEGIAATAYLFGVVDAATQHPNDLYSSVSPQGWSVGVTLALRRVPPR